MGHSCRTFVEEQSLLFSVRLACRRVRRCTDREQPRRKIVRRRQVTRTSRPHSKKWRALGCYLPSKWSGWTVRKRRKRAKRRVDPLGNLRRAHLFPKRSPYKNDVSGTSPRRVPETPPSRPTFGFPVRGHRQRAQERRKPLPAKPYQRSPAPRYVICSQFGPRPSASTAATETK
jgi:hypothetical protein